ncbi:leucine-rich alpha-2-glycoprotein [Xenopus tropicalis]|uniref:Leucine-rich alpha-2-glycoprotein n=1 Tax=Xenopus tropicalis TaxID=8364 RepID=A0A803JN07_XENTR|nr:leucine-rich alpha-2-glycoprotein [Xenopus tropicalis]|eukprot:XP_004911101.1 PREDICTED: phospholipase A2 inhibitor isoform X4 [Xenopus tropicalis]
MFRPSSPLLILTMGHQLKQDLLTITRSSNTAKSIHRHNSGMSFIFVVVIFIPSALGLTDPCPSLCNCTSSLNISVVCISRELDSFPCSFPLHTISISVEFTNITSLCNGSFSELPNLQELHLSNNALQSLPIQFFVPLSSLHTLDLTNNLIQSVTPTLFLDVPALRFLVLRGNLLTKLWISKISILKNLNWLDLSHNHLKEVNSMSFSSLNNLENLDLSYNQLHQLPSSLLKGLPLLQRLNLEGNNLSSLPSDFFAATPFLKHVFLARNSLHFLPKGLLLPVMSLKTLDLSENMLKSLPSGFLLESKGLNDSMEQTLDLSNNPWHCDCHLLSLHQWVTKHKHTLYFIDNTQCAGPGALKNRTLHQVTEVDLC